MVQGSLSRSSEQYYLSWIPQRQGLCIRPAINRHQNGKKYKLQMNQPCKSVLFGDTKFAQMIKCGRKRKRGNSNNNSEVEIDDVDDRYFQPKTLLPKLPKSAPEIITLEEDITDQTQSDASQSPRSYLCPDKDYFFDLATRACANCSPSRRYSQTFERATPVLPKPKAKSIRTPKDRGTHTHLEHSYVPLSKIDDIFDDIAEKASSLGFEKSCSLIADQSLRIVTMCSGTESPILAMQLLQQAYERKGFTGFTFQHLASAEIEPFKQAYIQRNFSPPVIFRDVTEFRKGDCRPHTAYGGQADQPQSIHLLIAGSSCVDYSSLNKEPKTFGKAGESYSTMKGIFDYASNCRPNAIILENVKNAPWKDIRKFWKTAEYEAEVVFVDSKNYYIPQTRQRGYLFAIDARRAQSIGLDCKIVLQQWVHFMESFQRRASSPYADFIFAEDDPVLETTRRSLTTTIKCADRMADWAACRNRYANFRASEQLGFLRPQTNWQNNGFCTFPDFSWHFWARSQRERIWDTLDIDQLRCVSQRGYDMNYKHRCLDLSQNMDRDTDNKHWGIIGCITPSGMPFETRRGGPITGRESLALQGIPVDSLILTRESSRQLQDLAGNAMTTTVIGAAIFSAILAGGTLNTSKNPSKAESLFEDFSRCSGNGHFNLTSPDLSGFPRPRNWHEVKAELQDLKFRPHPHVTNVVRPKSVQEILDLALRTRQLCACEGLQEIKLAPFFMCEDCGFTVCKTCKGNPKHNFREIPSSDIEARIHPSKFIQSVTDTIPRSLELVNSSNVIKYEHLPVFETQQQKSLYEGYLRAAFGDKYRFHSVKRRTEWKLVFEATHGRLELRFVPTLKVGKLGTAGGLLEATPQCYWLLFARGGEKIAKVNAFREMFENPIARMIPSEQLLNGIWESRSPIMNTSKLIIKKSGTKVESWASKLGLQYPKLKSQMINTKIEVQIGSTVTALPKQLPEVFGEYMYLPECGTASGNLYRKLASRKQQSHLFFFLDPEPLQNSTADCFVFAYEPYRRSSQDRRQFLAKLASEWRPTAEKTKEEFECSVFDDWKVLPDLKLDKYTDSNACYWAPQTLDYLYTPGSCHLEGLPFLVIRVPLDQNQTRNWQSGKAYYLDMIERPDSVQTLHWLLKAADKLPCIGHMHSISIPHDTEIRCECCSPTPPKLLWKWTLQRRSKKLIVLPFEYTQEADIYEKKLKARPRTLKSTLHCHDESSILEIRLNLETLLHRVTAMLMDRKNRNAEDIKVSWRVAALEKSQNIPKFAATKLLSNKLDLPWPQKNTRRNQCLTEECTLPPNFKRKLWLSQRKTLTWMQNQERQAFEWDEREYSELSLSAMNLQIEVTASIRRSVPSGILADEVGGGKTTTALALIAEDFATQRTHPVNSKFPNPRKLHSSATLILVPKNIMNQWKSEFRKCFTNHNGMLLEIGSINKLKNLHLNDIKTAKVILASWNLFDWSGYWTLMRQLCCAPNVPPQPGRAFQQWLNESLEDLGDLIEYSDGCDGLEKFWSERELKKEKVRKYERFDAFRKEKEDINHDMETNNNQIHEAISTLSVPKHVSADSVEYQNAFPTPLETEEGLDDDFWKEIEHWQGNRKIYPLLHMFSFHRVILDEFTYLEGRSLLAILALESKSRWMLSGTPPLSEYEGVNTMAKLLDTKISSDDEFSSFSTIGKNKSIKRKDQTYAEEFLYYSNVVSGASLQARFDLAGKFVKNFVRQNPTDLQGTTRIDHIIVIIPSAIEYATYFEFYLPITSQSFIFNKTYSNKDLNNMDRQTRITAAISHSSCAEQALICCFSEMRHQLLCWEKVIDVPNFSQAILESKEAQFIETVKALLKELREVIWYSDKRDGLHDEDTALTKFLQSVKAGENIGDSSVSQLIDSLLYVASAAPSCPTDLRINEEKRAVWKAKVEKANTIHQAQLVKYQKLQSKQSEHSRYEEAGVTVSMQKPEIPKPVPAPRYEKFNDSSIKVRRTEMAARTKELNTLSLKLVEQAKSLRFYHAVANIVSGKNLFNCSRCGGASSVQGSYILGICGHVICKECPQNKTPLNHDQDKCPQHGCNTISLPQHNINPTVFTTNHTSANTTMGSKMDAVVEQIRNIDSQEYVLIFVQYFVFKDHLTEALENAGIAFEDGSQQTRHRVNRFRSAAKNSIKSMDELSLPNEDSSDEDEVVKQSGYPGTNPHVLILLLDSPDSAGWNLQMVNHVVFVSPFVTKSHYHYDSIMTQAIGRALRFGQKKPVHVYHFVTARTIEVNILEERTKKRVAKRDGHFKLIPLEDVTDEDETSWSGPGLPAEVYDEGEDGIEDVEEAM